MPMLARTIVCTLGVGAACVALACSIGNEPTGVTSPSRDPYASLRLNVHTVTLSTTAPFDTVQLVATPYTVSGAVATGLGTPTFTLSDTTISLSATGVLQARSPTPGTGSMVIASLRDAKNNVTRYDTVLVVVTKTAPSSPLASFSLRRLPGDSAKVAVYDYTMAPEDSLFLTATAADGSDLRTALASPTSVRFTSADSGIATVTTQTLPAGTPGHPVAEPVGIVHGVRPGTVTIYAATTYYGVTRTDSLSVTIGNPIGVTISGEAAPSPTEPGKLTRVYVPNVITIGVGGTVVFMPAWTPPIPFDVVFDDPSAAQPSTLSQGTAATGSGNIGPIPLPDINSGGVMEVIKVCFPNGFGVNKINMCSASRAFPRAGTYHYHSALYGTSGTIVVQGP